MEQIEVLTKTKIHQSNIFGHTHTQFSTDERVWLFFNDDTGVWYVVEPLTDTDGFNSDDVPVGASHVGYYMGFNEFSVICLLK